jgi:alpha-tubulin suppressor-like RCC1 family protein
MLGSAAHALALTRTGAIFAIGCSDSGQLGLSELAKAPVPVASCAFAPVRITPAAFEGVPVTVIAAPARSSTGVTAVGLADTRGLAPAIHTHVTQPDPCPGH